MAEVTKGLENLQEAIGACQQASTVVATASAAEAAQARSALESVLASLNEVSDKFFIKTMMSVPPTKACKTEAAAVAALVADQKWSSLPAALEKLEKATKALVTKAKMTGRTLHERPDSHHGGAGSVGRSLVTRCRADGHTVRVFDLPVCDFTGLEGEPGIEVVQGDITQMATITQAVQGVSAVMHLAAILPPASERNRERTLAINVDGTMNIIRAMEANAREAVLVFSSSVSTYGDTTSETPPVRVEHPQTALDIYAESKIASERLVRQAQLPTVVLRIAGIAVPALQEPPPVWPFTAEQPGDGAP